MSNVTFEGKTYKDIDLEAQRVLQAANVHTFRYFPLDHVWMASDTTAEYFGINKFYHIGDDPISSGPGFVHDADKDKDIALYRKIISGEASYVSEALRGSGDDSYYKITLSAIERNDEGQVVTIAGIIEDYDEQMKRTQFAMMLADDYASVYMVNFDKDEVDVFRMNSFITSRYGTELTSKPSYKSVITKYIQNEVVEEERDLMLQFTSADNLREELKYKGSIRHDFRIMRDGKPVFIRMKIVDISETEDVNKVVVGFANVDTDKHLEWERDTFFDQITLGCNYGYYVERLKRENRDGYIVSMDVKAFKVVNDVCGIDMGDKVLQSISSIVEKRVAGEGFYGHVNADHFVFFLPYQTEEQVSELLDDIIDDVRALVDNLELPKISPYFGCSTWKPGNRIQVTFSEANTAKHKIKDIKELAYGFYREEDTFAALEEKRIEDAFDDAIAQKQFIIWYQPKYDPITESIVGAEALIRWKKPDGSMVFPNQFIPVYEKNGMIRPLDEYVFISVCEQQKKWLEKYGKIVPVSINLSRASLYFESIVEDYKDITDEIDISSEFVPIEITESAAVSNSDIKIIADKFNEAGFHLHMDDFGTGYSSLSTLNMLKFDTLKLDKSLIDYIGEFGGDRMIKHTIALARDLGIHVTAEGVESKSQVEFLKDVACDSIQGYYYAKPMPVDAFEELMYKS